MNGCVGRFSQCRWLMRASTLKDVFPMPHKSKSTFPNQTLLPLWPVVAHLSSACVMPAAPGKPKRAPQSDNPAAPTLMSDG